MEKSLWGDGRNPGTRPAECFQKAEKLCATSSEGIRILDGDQLGELGRDDCHRRFRSAQAAS